MPDLARDARHFGREGAELIDHGVDDIRGAKELAGQRPAIDLERHALRQIAFGDRADHARHFGRGLHEIGDEHVDRVNGGRPLAFRIWQRGALLDVAGLADDFTEPLELAREPLIALDAVVRVRRRSSRRVPCDRRACARKNRRVL